MSLYHEAAEILSAAAQSSGNLKTRVYGHADLKSPRHQVFALVSETAKWSALLKEVIDKAELLAHERKLTPVLSLLLVHDLLAKGGIALPASHGLRASVERHKARLASELTRARLRRGVGSLEALRQKVERDAAAGEAAYPRWVRINALKSSIEEQLETTFSGYSKTTRIGGIIARPERHIYIDGHVPDLVAVTPGVDLGKSEAYASGKIIFQDKASCFPSYLLDPRSEDGDVVDACAAPGNKTTHLAAIIHKHTPEFASRPQTIFAFERDRSRAKTLTQMVALAGSGTMTRIRAGQDFLQVDPTAEEYRYVGALLLDPSCSGSGIVGRDSTLQLHLPTANGKQERDTATARKGKRKRPGTENAQSSVDGLAQTEIAPEEAPPENPEAKSPSRLQALAKFQLAILLHAFRFPAATKITYSTCSTYPEENEQVVTAALRFKLARERDWRILRREQQVSGMREWPLRGQLADCDGDELVAEGCIRSYKDDGRGVMGFFVAAFVRDADSDGEEGPYLRDAEGRIERDALGMPTLKATGRPVGLVEREDDALLLNGGGARDDASDDAQDGGEWEGFGD